MCELIFLSDASWWAPYREGNFRDDDVHIRSPSLVRGRPTPRSEGGLHRRGGGMLSEGQNGFWYAPAITIDRRRRLFLDRQGRQLTSEFGLKIGATHNKAAAGAYYCELWSCYIIGFLGWWQPQLLAIERCKKYAERLISFRVCWCRLFWLDWWQWQKSAALSLLSDETANVWMISIFGDIDSIGIVFAQRDCLCGTLLRLHIFPTPFTP